MEGIQLQALTMSGVGCPVLSLSQVCCPTEYLLNEPPRGSGPCGCTQESWSPPTACRLDHGPAAHPQTQTLLSEQLAPTAGFGGSRPCIQWACSLFCWASQWDHPFPWRGVERLATFQTSAGTWIYRACRILLCNKSATSNNRSQDPHA